VIVIDPPWPMKKIERAERKAGEMLREREPHQGGRPAAETGNKPLPVSAPPKLDDLGISKMQSSRWQKIADVPEAG
ncbi:MAG: hypothetical protein L0K86_26335, partial [Actinomycetia bacterium]|nr:hypothetical protein [Actinomycetes bacterium]